MEKQTSINTISCETLQGRLNGAGSVTLIDTLTEDHFQRHHLPSARNACVFMMDFQHQVSEIATHKTAPIVLYGSSGRTRDAEIAAEKLIRDGYTDVSVLQGGISAWKKKGLALEGNHPNDFTTPGKALLIENKTYLIDPLQSTIEWAGRNPGTRHVGTLQLKEGRIEAKDGIFSGAFIIDMRTIKNTNLEGDELQPVLESHLKSDDFFFVDIFPEVEFNIERAVPLDKAPLSSPNYHVSGQLALRGIRAELEFDTIVNRLPDGRLTAEAHFDFDRTRWNVIYGSSRFFEHLGMHLVFDFITLQLKMVTQ
ncbi:MAG: YceI family protein [Deltaproteobacteria bacterium]|nr:YceI family protein [Deltaproteobacteria bacterium]